MFVTWSNIYTTLILSSDPIIKKKNRYIHPYMYDYFRSELYSFILVDLNKCKLKINIHISKKLNH